MIYSLKPPACTCCGGPLICQPTQPAWEITQRICQNCHEALNVWLLLASAQAPHRGEVRH